LIESQLLQFALYFLLDQKVPKTQGFKSTLRKNLNLPTSAG